MNTNMELEVPWTPQQVLADLQKACRILTERCLKISARWAAEQMMGLSVEAMNHIDSVKSNIPDHLLFHDTDPAAYYARTLLELGEYAHAAAVLSDIPISKAASVETMPPPSADLSPYAFYLRAYALYMAGERRKEEEAIESSTKSKVLQNPYEQQLVHELQDAYEADRLDAFGLHVYGMVLKSHKKSTLPRHYPSPQTVLLQSLLEFPYNWSAWLDLAEVSLENSDVEREIEDAVQPLAENFMFHFFCAHLQSEHQAHSEALQIYERWMDPGLLGGSPYLATQAALVNYNLRNYASAKRLLEDLHNAMPYRLDSMDVLSNILYVQEDSVALGQLAHSAVVVDKYRAETCCIVGNFYSLKQNRAKAIQYFQRALKMDRTFASAWTLMGHEYVEWKQTANAMEAYRQAVQANPNDFRAWYGLGQTYEMLEMNLYALYYYKHAAQLRPFDARMWTAVGNSYTHLKRRDDAIRAYERALQHDDLEGIATQKLAALYRGKGESEKAAKCYLQHLKNRFHVTHKTANRQTVFRLDALTLQGLVVDPPEAEALLYLSNYYRNHGEFDKAAVIASRLLEYPGPEKEEAKALLREIRSRNATRSGVSTRSRARREEEKSRSSSSDDFVFSP